MQGWPGGPSSLSRLNPIYSENEDASAGRSKASSSGYGSQRGSGGGSLSDRPPPPSSLRNSGKNLKQTLWHADSSEDPYAIYSTCSLRDELNPTEPTFAPRKNSCSTPSVRENFLKNDERNFSPVHSKYFSKFSNLYTRQKFDAGIYTKDNKGFVDDDASKANSVYDSDEYASKHLEANIENLYQKIDKKARSPDDNDRQSLERVQNKIDTTECDSFQADPFLLYSKFIEQEDAKDKANNSANNKPENEFSKRTTVKCEIDVVENDYFTVSEKCVSLRVAREDYLRTLLQEVAVALDEAIATKKFDPQGMLLQEAQERVAMGLVALRRSGPEELRQLSQALARGPPRPLPAPSSPPPPSSHALKPSLWYHYYMKANSIRSNDSINNFFVGDIRPEAQFTLGVAGERRLAGRLAAARRAKCVCRSMSAILALCFFLLALVICSLLLSGGRAMFGSMM